MKARTAIRHIREGNKHIFRNGWMTFASISAISISLFILGVFLLLALNINYFTQQIGSQVQIRVFLDVNTPQDEIATIQNQIGSISNVVKVTFVSKEQGMQYMMKKFGAQGKDLLAEFQGDNNPLNDSYVVEANQPENVVSVADQIRSLNDGMDPKPIIKVYDGKSTVETLIKVIHYVRNIGLVLVTGLALTAMFLISNTIKLTIVARRKEIGIMKLVGATNNFIRWPFFVEGALLGIVGSLIPVIILLYGYWEIVTRNPMGIMMMQLKPFNDVGYVVGGLLLGIGIIIGIWGTTISVRKFLRV